MSAQFNLVDPSRKEIVRQVCNGVLTEIAPEELILADQIIDFFVDKPFDSPDELDSINHYIDTPLGFGGNGELYAAIIVPIIIGALSKIITSFSDEKLKQAVDVIYSGKSRKGLEVETKVDEIKREITIRLSSKSLTRKKATIITNRILRLIAEELSR
ncbi:hypothetical protein CO110_00235 [Candidatus Desantisbacteria bacterium CG_4_9_14_3_um_filter_40_11]|uniref:Uncharacterized protein n=1 Tax=Candidatus Desantisbacteria bacterium CG_4_9_14_3_um_filter_40_11 TaxID=1974546 RepID=A0A2M8AWB7_9BACT|nr:MAG: hypothetical protein CO110_00235 [Candidatus Desantisbacteria bacterium CG_4_9_14_3_um_filter_40_11]